MKSRSPLFTIAVGLVAILLVSMGMIALGSRESRTFPSANSYTPSGISAFAELLRSSGYNVIVDGNAKPKVQPGDLVIGFELTAPVGLSLLTSEADIEQLETARNVLKDFVERGGSMLSLSIAPDFANVSKALYDATTPITSLDGQQAKVSWDGDASPTGFYVDSGDSQNASQVWGTTERDETDAVDLTRSAFVIVKTVEKGKEANVANGIVATNRFIDRQQNALVLMDTVRMLAQPGQRIVFAEATFGNARQPGLLETIGPWAVAAWMQILFLGAVIIYTLGKPFGLPDAERRKERGARELMDAIADTMRRGRMSKMAIRIVIEDTNRLLRKMYRGKRDPSRNDLQANEMGDLHQALTKLEAAAEIGAPESVAAKMIQDVEGLVQDASTKRVGPY